MSMKQMLLISFNTQLAEFLTEYYGEKEPATLYCALQKCFWLGFFLYPPPPIPEGSA